MKEHRLVKPNTLALGERLLDFTAANQIKIKNTLTLVDNEAAKAFAACDGKNLIPLQSAAALISDPQQNDGYRKGERVYVDPFIPCKNCYSCKLDNPLRCSNLQKYGDNSDGFLAEFKIVPEDNLKLLPDAVTDENALFIELVSRGINILDKLSADKGEYIVVCGSDILSNIICQLSLYYQIIPILIDNNEINIEVAKKYGVYYTAKADAECVNFIKQITGGRMTENLVALSSSQLAAKYVAECCMNEANVVFSGVSTGSFISYNAALKKGLQLSFVDSGYGNITSAINILANKAVKTDSFIREKFAFVDSQKAFESQLSVDADAAAMSAAVITI